MNNGINFAMDGPIMEGTWYNPNTNDSFTVRDTFFENNQLLVSTTDGRMLDYNTIQNYIKSDKPLSTPSKNLYTDTPKEILDIVENNDILEEDMNLLRGNDSLLKNNTNYNQPVSIQLPSTSTMYTETTGVFPEDYKIVERVLKKTVAPKISVSLDWKKFPMRQMELLVDMMDISLEDIADYFIRQISLDDIKKSISEQILSNIEKQLYQNNFKDDIKDSKKESKTKNTKETKK